MTATDVAILGAGLTGMSAAHHLRARGVPFRIFEKATRAGGLAVTDAERGYRFDRTGHLLHLADPELLALAERWMGSHRVIERNSAVWSHGVYTRYPFQANAYGLPPQVAYDCVTGFLDACDRAEPGPFESFADFCEARFGRAISERFMLPYNSRLWGVPPSEITPDWCQRFVPIPSREDVIAGAVGLRRQLGYNQRFYYPHAGIGALSNGLAADLGCVELDRAPTRIEADRLVFADDEVPFRRLISTIPLPILMGLLGDVPSDVAAAASRLRATHLYYLDVALRRPVGQPYHWIYVPEERYPFYRVGCYSHFSPAMAPPGAANLYVELVDRAEPDLGTLLPQVVDDLIGMDMLSRREDVVFARVRRIDHAYVIFDHAHYPALAIIEPFLRSRGILSVGRYGGWGYSSMGDALRFGRDAAATLAEELSA